jgi:uncharacterized cupredoxin-like copper-binding protein
MTIDKTWTAAFVAALWLAAGSAALAHGDDKHAKPKAAAVKEQKPWGIAGDAGKVTRTIQVTMTDKMRFVPDRIALKRGDTVRFVVKNEGAMLHEMVIGTKKDLDEHAALMVKFPEMEHDEPYMTHVKPGATGEIVWRFNRAGRFDFACLIAGHYQAGMVGVIDVSAK